MARPPATKPQPNTDGYKLPAPIKDPMQELLFLLGRLNGTNTSTAERITELVLSLQSQWQTRVAELEKAE